VFKGRNVSKSFNKIIVEFIFFSFGFILLTLNLISPNLIGVYVLAFLIISSVHLIFKSQRTFLIINIFMFTYVFSLIPFYLYDIQYHIYDAYQTKYMTSFVMIMQNLFMRVITTESTCRPLNIRSVCHNKSPIIFYIALAMACIFNIYTLLVSNSIIGGGYENSSNEGTILLEYIVIPLVVAAFHSKNRNQSLLLLMLLIISMMVPLLYGKRMPFIFISMIIYLYFMEDKLSKKTLLISIFVALFGIQILGVIRDSEYSTSLVYLLFGLKDNGDFSNNQGGVISASVSYLGLISDGIFDLEFRLISLVSQFLVAFIPSSFAPKETFINISAMEYTSISGNGGFTSTYFYLFLGPVGVVIFSYIFRLILSIRSRSVFLMILPVLTIVIFPRWLTYSIFPFIKILIWGEIIYFFVLTISRINRVK